MLARRVRLHTVEHSSHQSLGAFAAACLLVLSACSSSATGRGVTVDSFPAAFNEAVEEFGSGIFIGSMFNDEEYCTQSGKVPNCGAWNDPARGISVRWDPRTRGVESVLVSGRTLQDESARSTIGTIVATISVLSGVTTEEARDLLAELVVAADANRGPSQLSSACIQADGVTYRFSMNSALLILSAVYANTPGDRADTC